MEAIEIVDDVLLVWLIRFAIGLERFIKLLVVISSKRSTRSTGCICESVIIFSPNVHFRYNHVNLVMVHLDRRFVYT